MNHDRRTTIQTSKILTRMLRDHLEETTGSPKGIGALVDQLILKYLKENDKEEAALAGALEKLETGQRLIAEALESNDLTAREMKEKLSTGGQMVRESYHELLRLRDQIARHIRHEEAKQHGKTISLEELGAKSWAEIRRETRKAVQGE